MMTFIKKRSFKKKLKVIIIALLIYIFLSFAVTKIIYDISFKRYDSQSDVSKMPEKISEIVRTRDICFFESGKNTLCGYFYKSGGLALVVVAPGFNASADMYLPQIRDFLEQGYDVFTFDYTGSCNSEGKSAVGFSQEILDLDNALKFIENNDKFVYNNILLFGHSRGGYSVCGVLNKNHNISAVVTVSGIDSAMDGIMMPAVKKIGNIAYGNFANLWLYQTMLFGADTVNMEASEEISAVDTPVLVVHGKNDDVVSVNRFSIISHKEEIEEKCDNAKFIICDTKGKDGHTNLLFDADGTSNDELMKEINQFYSDCIEK
jgi:alpha-beta hydrolase superfamily lysophospholipase